MEKQTKAVIYCRVSSKEQEEVGYSLPAQEKYLREYANRAENGFEVVKVFQISESAAGKIKRKIFHEMMDYIKKNHIHLVIVETTDRLTRNFADVITIDAWVLEDERNQIHLTKEGCILHKNSKSHEWFMWRVKVATAEYYVKLLSENVRKGQTEKIEQGWLPTKPPLGYKTIGDKGHKIHVIDTDVAPFIKKAFEWYASGNYSMERVREMLYKEGFRTRAGNKPVKNRIEAMLKEPFYYGAMRWNDVLHAGKHEPIISKDLFDKAQHVRTQGLTPKYSRHQFQFRKMMKCEECGCSITAEIQKGIVYYHCSHYKPCSQKAYTPEDIVEKQIFGVFEFFKNITPREAELIKAKIKENHKQETEYKDNALKSLNARYIQLQSRLDILYNDRLDQKISDEFWHKKQEEINKEQKEVQEQITRIKSEETKYFEVWLNIIDLAHRALEIYKKRSPEERRLLLAHIFSNLTLKNKKLTKTLTKPVEVISKRVQEKIDAKNTFELEKTVVNKRQKDSFESLCPALLPRQDSNLRPIA